MPNQVSDLVPAVAANIVYEDVEAVCEIRPEGSIGIDREPISMTNDEPRAIPDSMPTQQDAISVRHAHLVHLSRFGDLPNPRH